MLVLNEAETRAALPFEGLIDALYQMFREAPEAPKRHHHSMEVPGEAEATLLLMPAWLPGRYLGVKTVTVFPDNGARGLPSIFGSYMLSSGKTGQPLAMLDGGELTARRTAAASALASRYLSRKDSARLLIVGTGRLAANLAEAHASVRPIKEVVIWGRDVAKAQQVTDQLASLDLTVSVATHLEAAAEEADIISCCTLSEKPLILGSWLKPGVHLDLIGAYKPSMRESDDEAVRRARLFVDTRVGALSEGGDLLQPIRDGVITADDIVAELSELTSGRKQGRKSDDEITLFKSVGASLEDLAGAIFAFENVSVKS